MSRMCILVPQANFSDGGFAKLAHLARTIFFFYFILFVLYGRAVGLVGLPLSSF